MPETMKAMLLKELGPVESKPLKLTEIPKHEISTPTEVLIKIEACGCLLYTSPSPRDQRG